MRAIKFRGLRTDGKGWLFGDLYHVDGVPFIKPTETPEIYESPDAYEVNPDTIGQFTTATDWRDDVEPYEPMDIFAGDSCVVGSIHPNVPHVGREGVVKFYEGAFWLDFGDSAIPVWSDSYHLTITGNIHENP